MCSCAEAWTHELLVENRTLNYNVNEATITRPLNRFKPSVTIVTDRSNAVLPYSLLCMCMVCLCVSISVCWYINCPFPMSLFRVALLGSGISCTIYNFAYTSICTIKINISCFDKWLYIQNDNSLDISYRIFQWYRTAMLHYITTFVLVLMSLFITYMHIIVWFSVVLLHDIRALTHEIYLLESKYWASDIYVD